jgi:hypothetical protein
VAERPARPSARGRRGRRGRKGNPAHRSAIGSGTTLGGVNSVPDASTGPRIPAVLARHGLVRVCAHVPAGTFDLTGLRVLLTADVLARVTELRGLQAFTRWTFTHPAPGQEAIAGRVATELNIHPPAAPASSDSRADVKVEAAACRAEGEDHGAVTIVVASALLPSSSGPLLPSSSGLAEGHEDMLTGRDALAVRMALLSCSYHEPAELTEVMLANTQVTLGQWRNQVAGWAESPSRPVPGQIIAAYRTALEQLDTAAILAMLHTVAAESTMAPGAKFETFLHADRVLGLDLASGIGRSA